MVEAFVARQPIFDLNENVFAYELLYRSGFDNFYSNIDGNKATSEVLASSFLLIGIEKMTEGKKAFINFTKELIEDEIPTMFDNNIVVIEILENIEPDPKLINICQKLKKKGYLIALDDFVFDPKYLPLIEIADIIKVDFLITSSSERKRIARIAKKREIKLLAEKVETREEFEDAIKMGYSYFQGYFFSKPVILTGTDLPTYPNNYFQILNEVNKTEPNVDKIASIVERDVALTYKLLRLINSAAFALENEITSVKTALVLLGLTEVQKWINLIVIKDISEDKPDAIIRTSIIRAKFSEQLAIKIGFRARKSEFFLMGMFSMIDVLMNRELEGLLKELPISRKIKRALLGWESDLRDVFRLVLAYERGNWIKVSYYIERFNLNEEEIGDLFIDAIEWCNDVLADD